VKKQLFTDSMPIALFILVALVLIPLSASNAAPVGGGTGYCTPTYCSQVDPIDPCICYPDNFIIGCFQLEEFVCYIPPFGYSVQAATGTELGQTMSQTPLVSLQLPANQAGDPVRAEK